MGFVKDVVKAGLSPGLALLNSKKKKKPETPGRIPTMISTAMPSRPTSMIGAARGTMGDY